MHAKEITISAIFIVAIFNYNKTKVYMEEYKAHNVHIITYILTFSVIKDFF